jgi:hypothetical protein
MPIIEVPGHGDVEFPDDMSDDAIAEAIRRNVLKEGEKPTTSTGRPVPSSRVLDFVQGLPGAALTPIKAGIDFMSSVAENTPGGPLATAYPPAMMIGAARTLGHGAKAFASNAERRAQSAMDMLDTFKQDHPSPSLGEFLSSPEAREAARQVVQTVTPETETEEIIPGSGGTEVPTGRALADESIQLLMANPPVKTLSNLAPMRRIASATRALFDLEPASEHLKKLETPHPLNKLEPHELGGKVGAQEEQVFKLRKAHGNKLYKALDDFTQGASIRNLLDEEGNLLVPKGVDVPKDIADAAKALRRERAALPKTAPDQIATSPELDLADSKLDDIPFSSLHDLRKSINERIRSIDPHNPTPDYHDLTQSRARVQNEMEASAHNLSPEEYAKWKAADDFWKTEVAEKHYRGQGSEISRRSPDFRANGSPIPGTGAPASMHKAIRPMEPGDVEAIHQTLVPKGDWAPTGATASGQKAFDHLIEQRIRTELGGANAGEKIDLTRAGKAIDSRIGRPVWEKMKELASPDVATRMNSLEAVARAYEKIGADTPLTADAAALNALSKKSMIAKVISGVRDMKPEILRWALEHPARTEILTAGLESATSTGEAQQLAARNVSNIVRLYDLDKGGPPETPNVMKSFKKAIGL